jgi:thiosulfate dehydrogenase [quinone] large subunit
VIILLLMPALPEKKAVEKLPKNWDATLAFWLLRGWLGVRAIMTGLEKYAAMGKVMKPWVDPKTGQVDTGGAMVEATQKVYGLANYSPIPQSMQDKFAAEPLLPAFMLKFFYAILGPTMILLGVMLLTGIGTRISLFVQGLIYIMLTTGLILIKADDGVAWLAIHIALIAMALVWAKNDKLSVDWGVKALLLRDENVK